MIINTNKQNLLEKEILKELKEKQLQEIDINNNDIFIPKFNINYLIPGFYKFYEHLTDFISNNIAGDYRQNENKLRKFIKGDIIEVEKRFHKKEKDLLNLLHQEIRKNKMIFSIISENKIDFNLILRDYITYFLLKYCKEIKLNEEIYHNFINLILDLRFNPQYEIIKMNEANKCKIFLIKIIWLVANKDNILLLFDIYIILKDIFKTENELLLKLKEMIKTKKIRYITNDERNPIHTTEVNECFYIILACMCISTIKLNIPINNSQNFYSLKKALKIIQYLEDNLSLYLNEMFMIDTIISIYETLSPNECENYNVLNSKFNEIVNNIIESNEILQSSDDYKYDKLSKSFSKFFSLLKRIRNNENQDHDKILIKIFSNEIKKVSDENYRTTIFKELIKNNETIRNSGEILQILFKKLIIPLKDKFIKTINN